MLRTLLTTTVSLAAVAALSGPAWAETRAMDVGAFTAISINSELTAKIVVGGSQSVRIDADEPTDLDDIRVEVRNGRLSAWRDNDFWDFFAPHRGKVTVTVSVPSLDAIEAGGASDVEASGVTGENFHVSAHSASNVSVRDVTVDAVRIDASSSAYLLITGSARLAKVDASSAADISAADFAVVDIGIEASSGSHALMSASGVVTADASSGAKIELAGHPTHVDDDVDSGADVEVLP